MKKITGRAASLLLAVMMICMQFIPASAQTEAATKIKSLSVRTMPTKTTYVLGVDMSADLAGMQLDVVYDDDTTALWDYDVDGMQIDGEQLILTNKSIAENGEYFVKGANTLSIAAGEVGVDFTVTAEESKVSAIAITKAPTRAQYVAGQSAVISREGMQVTVFYLDGTTKVYDYDTAKSNYLDGYYMSVHTDSFETRYDHTGNEAIEYSDIAVGENVVTVSYMNKTATFNVAGIENPVKDIEIAKKTTKTDYILYYDGEIVLEGLEVKVNYNDGTSKTWKYNDTFKTEFEYYGFDVAYDLSKVGSNTVTVTYLGKTAQFEVNCVKNQVKSIRIKKLPKKTEYYAYFDSQNDLDLSGMTVEITYLDGKTAEWSYDLDGNYYKGYQVFVYPLMGDIVYGENQVHVEYMGRIDSFTVQGVKVVPTEPEKEPTSLAGCVVTGITAKTYTGKEITLPIKVILEGKTLVAGTDYSVAYVGNKNVGNAIVRITGKGDYTGTILDTFVIRPKKVTVKSVKSPKKKRAKITWNKVTGASGYIVRYSNKSGMKTYTEKVVSGGSKTSITLTGLKRKKKVYVKVRAYKDKGYTTYKGVFSAKKSVKVK